MAWVIGKLSDIKIKAARPGPRLRKLSDGKGLQLWVTPQGGKWWRFEFRFNGKRGLLAIGTYPEISAANAREIAGKARTDVQMGIDPYIAKMLAKQTAKSKSEHTFEVLASRLLDRKRREGKALNTLTKKQWVIRKINRTLGKMPITTITARDIIAAISVEEHAGRIETAIRMRSTIGEVFRYAIQLGITESDPSQATRGVVARPKSKHHPAITDTKRLAELLMAVDDYAARNPLTGAALKLMALLYPRPGELRAARWDQFNLDDAIWTIPAEITKMRRPHIKPLSAQAVAILRQIFEISGPHGFVFPAVGRGMRPMSENTMNQALRRCAIGRAEHVSHGFRSTASTLLNASGKFRSDEIEMELAHMEENKSRKPYNRNDGLVERRVMQQWWADRLDQIKAGEIGPSGNVLSMQQRRSGLSAW